MGATLSSRTRATALSEHSDGKLEFSPENEALLLKVMNYVETLVQKHPREAQVIFKTPFKWNTSLRPEIFEGDLSSKAYEVGNDLVTSLSESNGEPHLILQKVDKDVFTIKAYTFDKLNDILQISGDKKLEEIRMCLQENNDPISNIMGGAFARVESNDNALLKANDMLSKARADATDNVADLESSFNLLLLINQLDLELLYTSVSTMAREVRLSPETVEREFDLLKSFTGQEENSYLESISWLHEYTFENGCRAPPWRQVHGDIAYIDATSKEGQQYYITASTIGYYINGGLDTKGELIYERSGDVFASLSELLKAKSAHFAQIVSRQEFQYEDKRENKDKDRSELTVPDEAERPISKTSQDERGKSSDSKKGQPKPAARGDQKKTKGKPYDSKEPSQKWKQLNLSEEQKQKEISPKAQSGRTTKGAPASPRKTPEKLTKPRKSFAAGDEDFSESSSESEEEDDTQDRRQESNADLPSEYWQIQKLVKYLKGGNQTATVIALCAMHDFNLGQEACQLAIRDVGGLDVLINLLETREIKCKIGSLKILKEISANSQIRKSIADLGGLQTMVKILQASNKNLRCLAAETIANVAKFRRARRTVRQFGGIKELTALLDCGIVGTANQEDVNVARAGALALWSCSKSTKNKLAIKKAGGIPLLAKLLKSDNESMLIPVVGTLQECASENSYRLAIRTEGMIGDLVRNLKSDDPELQKHCASAIFKCAEDAETRDLVREFGGLDPLVSLLANSENKELLAAVTGAIWKCAISDENVLRFQELKAIEQLVTLLTDQPEEVLINVVGALGECAKIQANRMTIRKAGGIAPMVNLLTGTNQQLLVNVTRAVGQCAMEADNMAIIDRLDGVRLLWSLLKSTNTEVQSNAAWAICPCIENAKDAGEMVRSFVGGLELIVSLLKSEDKEVLASVCAAIANIAKDEENLAVITDHGVVPMLAKLTYTSDDKLRHHLAEAIARCCSWGNNRVSFGQAGAVAPLVRYLKSKNPDVHRSTAKALYQLSRDPNNCIAMHSSGVVKPLMAMVGSSDDTLQEAAAGCLGNIRRLALANEKAKYH